MKLKHLPSQIRKKNKLVNIYLINDAKIKALKKKFFGVSYVTDVISFPFWEQGILGEIVISLDAAKRQAGQRRVALQHELLLLGVHGLMHLQGLEDEDLSSWKKMRQAEFETLVRIIG
ncbi:MAG: rRNA maturation RNase YbeY [Pseudomonadota bacterium]